MTQQNQGFMMLFLKFMNLIIAEEYDSFSAIVFVL